MKYNKIILAGGDGYLGGGVINCAAPEAICNTDLMKLLRRSYGIPSPRG